MKALILAAGLGTRLKPITDNIPKSLVQVNGKSIILKQIENLYLNEVDDITVVSGYKSEILKQAVQSVYPRVKMVESVDFLNTNNMYSAYLGLKSMFHNNDFNSFFMMNADVFFDATVLTDLKSDNRNNLIVTDIGHYYEESMKVEERDGRLIGISKEIIREYALGSSIDVYKFGKDGAMAFFNSCRNYIEEVQNLRLWSEVALNEILSSVEFYACPVNGRWMEIDNLEDLRMAESLFV